MGLRGRLPADARLRLVTGQRRRPRPPRRLPATPRATLKIQIGELRRIGIVLLKRAEKKPTVQTRNNGEQIHPALRAALELLEQADRCEARYVRRTDGEGLVRAKSAMPMDELDAFKKKKPAR